MKKPFLLFEMLIALSLMGILLTFLFSFLASNIRFEKKIVQLREISLERQFAHVQLQDVFLQIRAVEDLCPFYTTSGMQEICLTFDHGIDPDPDFSGLVEGKLWVDEKGDLKLVYGPCPLDLEAKYRTETIFSNVKDVSWEFLCKETLLDLPKPIRKQQRWLTEWSQEEKEPPSAIRLRFKQQGNPVRFAFRLTQVHPIATWRQS